MAKKGGLGKGLNALFEDNDTEQSGTLVQLRVGDIEPNRAQPRKNFEPDALQELADSLREHGVLQPIIVRSIEQSGLYQIIAGERRWRAARIAGLWEIPALVIEADDAKAAELALIENLQRRDLNPIEEASGYQSLMETYGLTQEEVAQRVGKSRPAVANAVRLLKLPEDVLEALRNGTVSAGHARVLAGLEPEIASELLARVLEGGLSVRQLEKLVKELSRPEKPSKPAPAGWGDPWYDEVELSLRDHFGSKIRVKHKGDSGTLEIPFASREQLERITRLLAAEELQDANG